MFHKHFLLLILLCHFKISSQYVYLYVNKTNELSDKIITLSSRLALGMVLYAITFGIQALSGNIYLNLFLFSIAGIPTKIVALWLQNRFVISNGLTLYVFCIVYSLSVYLSVYYIVCLSVCLFVRPFACLPTCTSCLLPERPPARPSVRLSGLTRGHLLGTEDDR